MNEKIIINNYIKNGKINWQGINTLLDDILPVEIYGFNRPYDIDIIYNKKNGEIEKETIHIKDSGEVNGLISWYIDINDNEEKEKEIKEIIKEYKEEIKEDIKKIYEKHNK